jgi:Flp pilus assembly protein TadD
MQNNNPIKTSELSMTAVLLRQSFPKEFAGKQSIKQAMGFTNEQIYAWAAVGCNLAEQGSLSEAQDLLEGLAVIDPDNAFIHSCLGSFYLRINDHNQAAGELLMAIKLNPQDIAALTNLAEIYFEAADYNSAKPYLTQAIELDPLEKDPFGNRARVLLNSFPDVEKH